MFPLGLQYNINQHNCLTLIRFFFFEHHQDIRKISEGLCDTEDWSNGCWKFSFAITGI